MGLTAPPEPINRDDVFLLEFHGVGKELVAICPLYVTGIQQNGTNVIVRMARGSVADSFTLAGVSVREVIDRFRAAYLRMQDSFLAGFLRNDLGAMEDRVFGRLVGEMTARTNALAQDLKGGIRGMVKEELQHFAVSDVDEAPSNGQGKPAAKKK